MSVPPSQPMIFHITHVENLSSIAGGGMLLSDAAVIAQGSPTTGIGMSAIKRRRVQELAVPCHPGTKVGDYVPFYFCPRSVMLYVIHCANHPDLAYQGGQDPIVHLEANLREVISWADANNVKWAFSLSNAGAYYTEFRSSVDDLSELEWAAIAATDFRPADVKERKQAEFLLYGSFPFQLIKRIGVRSDAIRSRASQVLNATNHRPLVATLPEWYF